VKQRTETAAKIAAEKPSPARIRVQENHAAVAKALAKRAGISEAEAQARLRGAADPGGQPPRPRLSDARTIEGEIVMPGPFTPDEMGFFANMFPGMDLPSALKRWEAKTNPDALTASPRTSRQAEFMAYLRTQATSS
jgi:hypothetical protein